MPLEEFLAVAERLRPGGYRPTRFRPFANPRRGGPVLVAAVWTRDGLEWQFAHDPAAADVAGQDAQDRARSYPPVGVSGYSEAGRARYAVLWLKSPAQAVETQLAAGVDEAQLQARDTALRNQGYWRATTSVLARDEAPPLFAVLWSRPPGRKPPTGEVSTDAV